ncbi:MAG TPA: hypothetical protein DEA45_01850 [Acholeplasmataceae bacterium]|nr:hypothetical protein [Acholeplasmataceae bacterium]
MYYESNVILPNQRLRIFQTFYMLLILHNTSRNTFVILLIGTTILIILPKNDICFEIIMGDIVITHD